MTTINDTGVSAGLGLAPMLKEIRPGLIYQEPLTYYNLSGDDAPLTNAAFSYLQGKYGGGMVWYAPLNFDIRTTINVPWMCFFKGQGFATKLNYSGNGTAVLIQDPATVQPPLGQRHQISGGVERMIIDGTNAGPNAILLSSIDIHAGLHLDVILQNATGTNAIGWQCANENLAHNLTTGNVQVANCSTGALFTALGSETAIEHINVNLNCAMNNGQNGIHLANSVGLQSCMMTVTLSSEQSNAGAGCVMDANTVFQSCVFLWKHEMSPAPGTSLSIQFNAPTAKFSQCSGVMWFGPSLQPASGIAVPSVNNQFTFGGTVFGDNVLMQAQSSTGGNNKTGVYITTPAVPASGTAVRNTNGVACLVNLIGATLTAPTVVTSLPLSYSANIASPCIFTVFGHNLVAQQPVLLTQGTPPGGFSNGTQYYVATTPAPTANTFALSASPTGSPAINSSSTGSGTQNLAASASIGDTATRSFIVPSGGMILPTFSALTGWTWQPIA